MRRALPPLLALVLALVLLTGCEFSLEQIGRATCRERVSSAE